VKCRECGRTTGHKMDCSQGRKGTVTVTPPCQADDDNEPDWMDCE
jgi:hypothetical protein